MGKMKEQWIEMIEMIEEEDAKRVEDAKSGDLFRDDVVCDWCKEVVDSTVDWSGCGDLCSDCMSDGGFTDGGHA